jgi:NAD(P)-dependent dehydrogenase (short-subunit alcohol dehydrogenase family)
MVGVKVAKTVLITGASSGVGQATALHFSNHGWNVMATSRSLPTFSGRTDSAEKATMRLDVTDEASIASAVAETNRRFGGIDVLINNAGIGLAGPLESIAPAQIQRLFATNFFGAVAVTRAVIPQMRERGAGTIINVSSITGRVGLPFMSPYDASKFAIEGLSESLRYELEPFGIRIKLVEPGGVKTNFVHEWVRHPAYEPVVARLIEKLTTGAASAAGPEGVARVLFKAATDPSRRFRYAANGGERVLLLNRILPERSWRALVRRTFLNPRRSNSSA